MIWRDMQLKLTSKHKHQETISVYTKIHLNNSSEVYGVDAVISYWVK
jgi:hypothetical protein